MNILMLVPWEVDTVAEDDVSRQSANVLVRGGRYWFFRHLKRGDVNIDVIGKREAPLIDHIEKRLLRFHLLYPLAVSGRVRKYDMVFCFHSQIGIVLALLMSVFGPRGIPLIIFDVEGLGRKHNWWQRALIKKALPAVSKIFYFCTAQKEDYIRYFPEIGERAVFVPFGIDVSRYAAGRAVEEDRIISIGHQDASFRDWGTLLEAYALVGTKTSLLIVGKEDFGCCAVGRRRLPGGVELAGRVGLGRLNDLVLRSKFVVLSLPERRHSFAQMTLLGCMALGKAVIVSKVSGVIDYAEDGKTALFTRPYDAEDMRDKIVSLLRDPGRAAAIGADARRAVETRFTEEMMAASIFNAVSGLG
ncbi:MAG: glycosyltransferase family 4 protein [Candidatus Omnitrophota bacterium]